MKKTRWLGPLLTFSLLLTLLIVTDALPLLRGPQPDTSVWHWPYHLRPFSRWWPSLLAAALFMVLSYGWLHVPLSAPRWQTALWLTLVAGAVVALQVGLLFAERERPFAELVDRALAVQTNGYFWSAVHVSDIHATLATYPAQMRTFESDHVRTHPPGLLLANWQTLQAFRRWPTLAQFLAPPIWQARCTDLWLLNQPPHLAAALGFWAVLPLLMGATAVFPAYLLAKKLGHRRQGRIAALLVALLPALLVFTPTPDQLSATLTLWLIWLAVRAQYATQKRVLIFGATGLLLSLLSFISLGNAVLLLIVLAVWLLPTPASYWLREVGVFALGASAVWVLLWVGWGVPPWAVATVGLSEHEALVIAQRRYGVWTFFNLVDVLTFTGLPVLFGALAFAFANTLRNSEHARDERKLSALRFITQVDRRLAAGTVALIFLLTLSGSTRGEVGRIWLFLFPLLALFAGLFFADRLSNWQLLAVLSVQLLLALAVGLAWRPIDATIVQAQRPPLPPFDPDRTVEVRFDDVVMLHGYTLEQHDKTLELTLLWEAERRMARPYTVFNHLLNERGELVTQADGWSASGQWPTSCWEKGERVIDRFTLVLPDVVADGRYTLLTGLYDARDGTRLTLPDGTDAYTLQTVQVGPPNQ